MIYISNQNYEKAYFIALDSLISENNKLFNDKKIAYETNAMFEFDTISQAISIQNDEFVSNYDYDSIMEDGNNIVKKEIEYYSKYILHNNQFNKVINSLQDRIYTKQAMITLPLNDYVKMPCVMYIYFRVLNEKLYTTAHLRANNAYGLSLINMHIHNALIYELKKHFEFKGVKYYHIVDSFHIYKRDIDSLYRFMKKEGNAKILRILEQNE